MGTRPVIAESRETQSTHDAASVPMHRRSLIRGRTLISLGLVLLAIFGLVTALAVTLDPITLDVPITQELQEVNYGPFGALMVAVSAPGFEPWNFIFPIVIIVGVALLRRFVEAAFLALATVATGAAEVVKILVHRARPSDLLVHVVRNLSSYSFPSGHVTEYTLVFGFSFYLAFTLLKRGLARTLMLIFCGAMILLVGPSRIWLGQHWASDALGGYTLGFGLLLLVIWAYRSWQARKVKEDSPPGTPPVA